ncbi:hypothetical protein C8J29_11240 [Cereibacter johrii]|uniref:Uncharacterized protein n=1 Tax=Cereibacter johrii TaxID=445629 RepID=A0ABX5J3D8_9RHOB|nr:hypothetical protein C8J29_11240 [Cereibacter johrii]
MRDLSVPTGSAARQRNDRGVDAGPLWFSPGIRWAGSPREEHRPRASVCTEHEPKPQIPADLKDDADLRRLLASLDRHQRRTGYPGLQGDILLPEPQGLPSLLQGATEGGRVGHHDSHVAHPGRAGGREAGRQRDADRDFSGMAARSSTASTPSARPGSSVGRDVEGGRGDPASSRCCATTPVRAGAERLHRGRAIKATPRGYSRDLPGALVLPSPGAYLRRMLTLLHMAKVRAFCGSPLTHALPRAEAVNR